MNKECEITRDLISLYIDQISSDASRDYVEKHVRDVLNVKKS